MSLKNINMEMLTLSECSESTVYDLRTKLRCKTSNVTLLDTVCCVYIFCFMNSPRRNHVLITEIYSLGHRFTLPLLLQILHVNVISFMNSETSYIA